MNNIKEIEKLFNRFEELNDNYVDFPEIKESFYNAMNFLEDNKMPERLRLKVDELLSNIHYNAEKQGFIYGFQYAVSLLIGGDTND